MHAIIAALAPEETFSSDGRPPEFTSADDVYAHQYLLKMALYENQPPPNAIISGEGGITVNAYDGRSRFVATIGRLYDTSELQLLSGREAVEFTYAIAKCHLETAQPTSADSVEWPSGHVDIREFNGTMAYHTYAHFGGTCRGGGSLSEVKWTMEITMDATTGAPLKVGEPHYNC